MPDRPEPKQVGPMARLLADFFSEQRDAYVNAMQSKPMGLKYGVARKDASLVDQWLRAWGVGDNLWANRAENMLSPLMRQVLVDSVRGGGEWIRQANDAANVTEDLDFDDPAFGLENPRAVRLLKRQAETHKRGLELMNATTAEQIRRTLAEGLEAGDGLNDMQKRVRAVYDAEAGNTGQPMAKFRAVRIARTEVAQAQGDASLAGAANTGLLVRKVWSLSSNPCEFCRAAAREYSSKPVELDEPFYKTGTQLKGTLGGVMILDFRDIQSGTLHPNCVCDVRMVVEGVARPVARPAA